MIHPDFKRLDSESRLRHKNVIPVWRPARRSKLVVGIFRDLLHAAAVRMHDPEVFAALAVGNKRDPLSIGRKLWLAVERHPAIDQLCRSAFDRQRVNVTEQFEHNGFSIRRNIQREPRSLVRRELDLSRGLQRQPLLLVLFLVLLFVFLFLLILSRGVLRLRLSGPPNPPRITVNTTNHAARPRRLSCFAFMLFPPSFLKIIRLVGLCNLLAAGTRSAGLPLCSAPLDASSFRPSRREQTARHRASAEE